MHFDPIAYINEPRWRTSRLGLERISELLEEMGNPQDSFKSIHVAGTNGKGSISSFLASVLHCAHYKTGLFTSPGIMNDYDRIRVDNKNINSEDLLKITQAVKEIAERMDDHPTEFELMCAIAFEYFKQTGCDFAVIEVGMGGRLDSTNILAAPELCVITPISHDHMEYLGNSITEIATEKAGIIKDGIPVVSWPQEAEAKAVIEQTVSQHIATLREPDFSQLTVRMYTDGDPCSRTLVFDYKNYHELEIGLIGSYQPYNAAVAIEAVEQLRSQGYIINDDALRKGLRETRWLARFEIVSSHPTFVIDGGHNLQGVNALIGSLTLNFPNEKFIFIVGVLADKDYPEMLDAIVSLGLSFITITPPNPRALSAENLAHALRKSAQKTLGDPYAIEISVAHSVSDAISKAFALAGTSGIICAFGSLYSVAAIKTALAERQPL